MNLTANPAPQEDLGKRPRISELVLGVGDEVEITVFRQDDLYKKVQIPPDGRLFYPFVGEVQAAGVSVGRLRELLTGGLAPYFQAPQVSVAVTALRSEKVFVLGEVLRPGIFALDAGMSVVEAITKAGGFTEDAKWSDVVLIRGGLQQSQPASLDLKKTFKQGDTAQNVMLQNSDIVYVPAVFIADMARFFRHLETILRPIVLLEQGIILGRDAKDVLTGERREAPTIIVTPISPSR